MKYTKPSAGRRTCNIFDEIKVSGGIDSPEYIPSELGRFPSNVIFSDSILCGEDYEQYFYNIDNVELKNNEYGMKVKLMLGDCINEMKRIPDNYVDSIVTDPPAGISFMGKSWDDDKGGRNEWIKWLSEVMVEAKRTLKPGGHCFVWALPRTSHWTATALEDAGFEIRDVVTHVFGSGFPKSHNISKGIDKRGGKNISWFGEWLVNYRKENNIPQSRIAKLFPSKTKGLTGCVSNWELGNNLPTADQFNLICKELNLTFDKLEDLEREVVGKGQAGFLEKNQVFGLNNEGYGNYDKTIGACKESKQWEGWGSALKPASENWILCRKPLSEKTIADNVLKWGTGGINIDKSRITYVSDKDKPPIDAKRINFANTKSGDKSFFESAWFDKDYIDLKNNQEGRFPANFIHDGSDEVMEEFDKAGKSKSNNHKWVGENNAPIYGKYEKGIREQTYSDEGSAARFFYCSKASGKEKNAGCEDMPDRIIEGRDEGQDERNVPQKKRPTATKNFHPTIKPIKLMTYLINMITPPNGIVLDPFLGSGSTGVAAVKAGFNFIGIEKEPDYMEIAKARINNANE